MNVIKHNMKVQRLFSQEQANRKRLLRTPSPLNETCWRGYITKQDLSDLLFKKLNFTIIIYNKDEDQSFYDAILQFPSISFGEK